MTETLEERYPRRMSRSALFLSLCVACAGSESTESIEPVEVSSGGDATNEPNDGSADTSTMPSNAYEVGRSFDNPLPVCGAGESYVAVSQWRCADGSMPLGGAPEAGRDARQGSMGAHQEGSSFLDSHIVDLYVVPCPEGPVEVYVCLYHCPEGRSIAD